MIEFLLESNTVKRVKLGVLGRLFGREELDLVGTCYLVSQRLNFLQLNLAGDRPNDCTDWLFLGKATDQVVLALGLSSSREYGLDGSGRELDDQMVGVRLGSSDLCIQDEFGNVEVLQVLAN